MISGLYGVSFSARGNGFRGIVVLRNGQVLGGDCSYYYGGRYSQDGDKIKGEIIFRHWHGDLDSVMGALSESPLTVVGEVRENSLVAKATSPDAPGVVLQIEGIKLAEA